MGPESQETQAIQIIQVSLKGLEKHVSTKVDNLGTRVGEMKEDFKEVTRDLKTELRDDLKSFRKDLERRHVSDYAVLRSDLQHCKTLCGEEIDKLAEEDNSIKKTLKEIGFTLAGITSSRKTWNVIWTLVMSILIILMGIIGFNPDL
jgi:DNA repair exonuclease SbcCD ATPase subunit